MLAILLTFLVFNIMLAPARETSLNFAINSVCFHVLIPIQGVGGVAKWIVILLVAFMAIGFLFFGLDKLGKKKQS